MMENILSEGRYDKVTTELSREIVQAIKQGKKRLQTRITLFTRTNVEISVYFHYTDEYAPQIYGAMYPQAKDIRKHYKGMKIVFHVDVPRDPEVRTRELSSLVPEIKDIVRHEIEHVTQVKFKEKERAGFFSKTRRYPEDLEYWEYLTEPYEIEAYVRGLYKKAKTVRQPLNVLFNTWWDYLTSVNMHPDEIRAVKNAWTSYATRHLPRTPMRQYGYEVEVPEVQNVEQEEVIGESQRVMGFKYRKPTVNAIVNIEASDSGNIRFKLMDLLDRMNVEYNSITRGGSKHNSYTLDLNLFDEKETQAIINDLNIKLMLDNIRVTHSNYHIKEPKLTESIEFFTEAVLFEAKKDTLRSKYNSIPEEYFNMIVNGDPSPTKKYSEWMLRQFSPIPGEINRLIDVVNRFDKSINRISHEFIRKGIDQFESQIGMDIPLKDIDTILRSPKDINSYAGVGILNAILNQIESKKTKREEKLVGAEKIYEDENFLVVLPKTAEGSCHYGSGTRWCVASRDDNQFNNYSRRGTLYYIIFKANSVLNPERKSKDVWKKRLPKYEKIARYIPHGLDYGSHGEFYDAEDSQVDEDEILNEFLGVSWEYLPGLGEYISKIPKGTQPFYNSFYKAWTKIDTHYAKNGMEKYSPNEFDNDDIFDDDNFEGFGEIN